MHTVTLLSCFSLCNLGGVVPSLGANNDEVVDVLYRVQATRLSDAPRTRITTPGGGN